MKESGPCHQRVNSLQEDKDHPPSSCSFRPFLTMQFQKYFMKKETSVGAQITYARVYAWQMMRSVRKLKPKADKTPRNKRTPKGNVIA